MLSNFLSKIMPFMRKCGKISYTVGQAVDKNMAHAHYMLDNEGYKHTLRIFNT